MPIKFGTDGWRAIIGEEFSFDNVGICAQAISNYLLKTEAIPDPVIIGFDTRFGSDRFAQSIAEVLYGNGIPVILCDKPAPTPVVSYNLVYRECSSGIVVTASHNASEWNGIKFKPGYGGSASPEIVSQIENSIKEKTLRSEIPHLNIIDDKISQIVRKQYEENPYPRWINAGLSYKPRSIREVLNSNNIHHNLDEQNLSDKPDVLVAGCGTGRQALYAASQYLNSNVLAIDLSLNSLAYAMRKTKELGIKNIEYIQGDILKLNKLNMQKSINLQNRSTKNIGSLFVGMAFGAGWTPCIGPILAGILTMAAASSSWEAGTSLLIAYSAGLAIPFILSALAIDRFMSFFNRIKRWIGWIER